MGRLIAAGTGMEFYRNVKVERDQSVDQAAAVENSLDELPEIVAGDEARPPVVARAGVVVAAAGDGNAEEGKE